MSTSLEEIDCSKMIAETEFAKKRVGSDILSATAGGCDAGGSASLDPAVQTIPKHTKWAPAIRRCHVAPPGYVITERDYSQGELRVVACIADEDNMIESYKLGRDLHSETSGHFKGFSYEKMM